MRLQSNQANCGPTALFNAACALGKKLSLEECEKACRTTATEGTTARKLAAGAQRLGLHIDDEIKEGRADVAERALRYWMSMGKVAVITVDADSHWAAVIGTLGRDRYLVADSADNELVLSYGYGELLQRWQTPESRRGFYALVLS
jgi:ABC-type bacteriocin/lantibiotic exporter with double-glycine peptidase domain